MTVNQIAQNHVRNMSLLNPYNYFYNKHNYISSSNRNYVNTNTIQNVRQLADKAAALYDAADRLNDSDTYDDYRASSSNKRYVEVSRGSDPTAEKTFKIEVDQLAQAQTNKGSALSSDAVYTGQTGEQKFNIEIDGQNHEFSINIAAGDTNNQVLRKMAAAVNNSDIGVSAWVSNDRNNDTSSLVFQSEKTGDLAENHFTVSDVSGSNIIASTGAANVAQRAQDAEYTVNNRSYTSHDNNVNLGSGVKVRLKEETNRPITISTKTDNTEAMKLAEDFVNAYNDLLSFAKTGTNGSNRLLKSLSGNLSPYVSSLEDAGIEQNYDGSLSINDKKLRKDAANGDLKKAFSQGGINYGLNYRMEKIAKDVINDPAYYIGKSYTQSKQDISLAFGTRNRYYNPYDPWSGGGSILLNTYL